MNNFDVIVIGAGPAGAVSAASLSQKGYSVLVLEKTHFPRFVIGESLLPQCMNHLEELNMLPFIRQELYQCKRGAHFTCGEHLALIDFAEKSTAGASETWQVKRAEFDADLIAAAQSFGAEVWWGCSVEELKFNESSVNVKVLMNSGEIKILTSSFLVDASGYGRVLPRLLNLEKESHLSDRKALFTHLSGDLRRDEFQADSIQIGINEDQRDIWYWGIPFPDGTISVGVICPADKSGDDELLFDQLIAEEPMLAARLQEAVKIMPVKRVQSYSASVSQLWGERYVIVGNAGEFLDPVFSSGVSLAIHSAATASEQLHQFLSSGQVDWPSWEKSFMSGVEVFCAFVEEWYNGNFQKILFHKDQHEPFKKNIISILAGYVWDEKNPFCKESKRKLTSLATVCDDF